MALVGVEHLRRRMAGQRAERPDGPHPADAEQQLLAQPVVTAAAVQPVGDLVQVWLVLLDIRIEQQQRDPAHLRQPDLGGQRSPGRQADGHVHRGTAGVAQQLERQPVRVVARVALGLPAVGGQRLGEVPVPVQQPDPDQRHAEVAGRLQVVPGQDAQAAGILRQRGGDAVLRGEVGHRRGTRSGQPGLGVPARTRHVLAQVLLGLVQPAKEVRIGGQGRDPVRRQRAERRDRITVRRRPGSRVDRREQVGGRHMPGPAEVQYQAPQRGQRLGQGDADVEPANRSHGQTIVGPRPTRRTGACNDPADHRLGQGKWIQIIPNEQSCPPAQIVPRIRRRGMRCIPPPALA